MRPALLAAGLAVLLAVATCAAVAQPVAKLEVTKGSKSALSQHDRIEQMLQQLLELHRVAPPPVEPPPGPPKPPVDPPPPPPPPPAADNPFVAWCAGGSTIVEYIIWRNGGVGLSAAQEAQARAAGCFGTPTSPPGSGPGNGPPAATGNDLSDTAPHYFTFYEGQAQTFTCSVPTTRHVELVVFTNSGSLARTVVDSGPGFTDRSNSPGGTDFRHKAIDGVVPAGTITYTVSLTGILSHSGQGVGRFGIQCFR